MMEFLHFTFQSFWHFVGVLILIASVPSSLAASVKAVRGDWFDRYMRLSAEKMVEQDGKKQSTAPAGTFPPMPLKK